MACGPSWGASSLASTMPTELCVVPFEKRFTTVLSAASLLPAAAVRIAPARAVATKVQASGTSVHLKRRRLMDFASGFTVPKPSSRQLCFWFTRDDIGGRHGAKTRADSCQDEARGTSAAVVVGLDPATSIIFASPRLPSTASGGG